jgi:hypothetical protein
MISGDDLMVSVMISTMFMHYSVPLIESWTWRERNQSRTSGHVVLRHSWLFPSQPSLYTFIHQALRGYVCNIDYSTSSLTSNKGRPIGIY